jgi:hypothetical protein
LLPITMRLISTSPKRTLGSDAAGAACSAASGPAAKVAARPAEVFKKFRRLFMDIFTSRSAWMHFCESTATDFLPSLRAQQEQNQIGDTLAEPQLSDKL